MLPREKVRFLSGEMNREEATAYVRESGHSRFPFSPSRDLKDASAVVLSKDLLYWSLQNDGPDVDWDALIQEPLVVPESAPLLQLLHTYRETRRHLAIVVDEYGSIEGVVTLEDVLEEIVGDIFDETDLARSEFHEASDGTLLVRASVDLRKLCSKLEVAWEPDVDTSTIGGLVTEMLDRIPVAGDKVLWNGYEIEVLRADKRRPRLLRILSGTVDGDSEPNSAD
jgi:CBS domain containing-hemolysin-like protein